jgi:hypothetical protein
MKRMRDALLSVSKALPNGANTVVSDPIKVNATGFDSVANFEGIIESPAMTTAILADGGTVTYNVQMATDAAFTSPVLLYGSVLVQTGADGAGAAKKEARFALPSMCLPYIRFQAVKSGAGNASTLSGSMSLLF